MSNKPIGADVVYSWIGEHDGLQEGYISFDDSEYDPSIDYPDFDKYGIPDTEIFFSMSAEEFQRWISNPAENKEDFMIHSFEYRYADGGG